MWCTQLCIMHLYWAMLTASRCIHACIWWHINYDWCIVNKIIIVTLLTNARLPSVVSMSPSDDVHRCRNQVIWGYYSTLITFAGTVGMLSLSPFILFFFSVSNNFIPSHIILWCMHGTCFLYECPPTVPLLEGQSWLLAQNLSLSLFFFILSRFFATRLDHFQLQYSGKLSREKTFKNFADLGPPAEVFSMKLGMCYTR